MTINQIILSNISALCLLFFVYKHTGFNKIKSCYAMFFKKKYWTNYNTVEFLSWASKAIIIIPGLIFGISLWWLFFLTLLTSLGLVWASNKKLLPTLVGFNTIWTWISCMVLAQHIIK
jgi:hypothetical protein